MFSHREHCESHGQIYIPSLEGCQGGAPSILPCLARDRNFSRLHSPCFREISQLQPNPLSPPNLSPPVNYLDCVDEEVHIYPKRPFSIYQLHFSVRFPFRPSSSLSSSKSSNGHFTMPTVKGGVWTNLEDEILKVRQGAVQSLKQFRTFSTLC